MKPEIVIVPDPDAVAHEAARRFVSQAREAVPARGRFSVALSGGSTPAALYKLLADEQYREQIPWADVHLFWGDERCVPATDPGSNFRLADEALLRHVPLPEGNVHRVSGELEPGAAARAYTREMEEYFCGPHTRFDLVLLGLGSDGHTASLFAHSAALQESKQTAIAVEAHYQDRPTQRVTLTLPTINAARQILFLVTGEAKAGIVAKVLAGPGQGLPAQRIQPTAGQLTWLLDAAAAAKLPK
jgi:6-phosphogluconolactonase